MFKVYKKEIEVAGKKISLETGKVARQADGAIIASCGETVILATVVGAKKVNPDMDYFPLSVNYQEKYYAGGKIPGGYFKREARPTESEQLISRLIDRPIRPLFPSEFKNEVQLLPTVISYDKDTGSSEIQIALLTEKIETLSKHIKQFKKDKHTSVGLLRAVNRRKKLLEYLKKNKMDSYKNVLSKLNLRK